MVERRNGQDHGSLAIAKCSDSLRVFIAQKALLEGLQINQLFEVFPRFLEHITLKSAILALQCGIKAGFATKSHGQMGPVEMQGPLVRAADHNRGHIGGFELFDGIEQVIPCRNLGAVHARFCKQLFVIHEADLRNGVREAVDLAIDREGFDGGSGELVLVRSDLCGNVLEHTGIDLRFQHAARPAVDDVGPVLGLQQGRGFGLVGLVFEELHLDFHAGVLGLEIARDLFPDFDLIGVHLDVQPFERGIRPCRAGKARQSNRRAQ